MRKLVRLAVLAGLMVASTGLMGCQKELVKDYARPLPEGVPALRKITNPKELPDLKAAYLNRGDLVDALNRSLGWFAKTSTQQFYPLQGFTHDQAQASVLAFKQILLTSSGPQDFQRRILQDFDVWTSVGWDGSGVVYFTGYYTPVLTASRVQTPEYKYPLYTKPADLVRDPATGQTLGRQIDGQLKPYPTGAQIEYYPQLLGLTGHELVWLRSKLDRYIVRVQGSAKLHLTDGSTMYIGYAADNGRPYTSIAKKMVEDGRLDPDHAGLPAIRQYFEQHPQDLDYYISQNERYIFFQTYDGTNWPAGSLGFQVTPFRTLATDKKIFPRACPTLVVTKIPSADGGQAPFDQFMVDQDTGGAIRAPGRADIYMGIGSQAEAIAGQQAAEGRLYYFILKPDRVQAWLSQASAAAGQVPVPAPAPLPAPMGP